jgi:hypothetical protein
MPQRAAKRTANPASVAQKRTVGRLINLMIAHGTFESIEDAQADFFDRTGYKSLHDASAYNCNILTYEYADLLRLTIQDRLSAF